MFEYIKTKLGISAALQFFETDRGDEMAKKDKKPEKKNIGWVLIEKTREVFIDKSVGFFLDKSVESVASRINIKENTASLMAEIEGLKSVKEDVCSQSAVDENVRGVKRKREVKNWLDNVREESVQCQKLYKEVQDLKSYYIVSSKSSEVTKRREEVRKLVEQRRSFQSLVFKTPGRDEVFLVISKVEGDAFKVNLEKIKDCANDNNVWRIGIYGVEGVGKTALALHLHDDLIRESNFTGGVYFISVSHDFTISKLQDKIAKTMRIDVSDENDERKRAGILFHILRNKQKYVIILDDVQKDIEIEKVGIPYEEGDCKLIIISRSRQICRTIGCKENIGMEPLCNTEACRLFEKTYGEAELNSEAVEIIQRITEKCGGLPKRIVDIARRLRGITDIHELRDVYESYED